MLLLVLLLTIALVLGGDVEDVEDVELPLVELETVLVRV